MPCPYETASRVPLDLNRYRYLHPEGKRLIEQWFQRAVSEEQADPGAVFEAFIFLWFSFNGFAACITGKDQDRSIIEGTANCPNLRDQFSRLVDSDEAFRRTATLFGELWPIFKVQDLRAKGVAFRNFQSRQELITHHLAVRGLYYKPECFMHHKERREPVPIDWPHTLHTIYRVRCNLFHGEKSPSSEMDIRIVKAAFAVLSGFLLGARLME